MRFVGRLIAVAVIQLAPAADGESRASEPHVEQHVVVYGVSGQFAGWPANHGIWNWGDEILVGFSAGTHKDLGPYHNIDREKPEHHLLARSLDGGMSWTIENPAEKGQLINARGMRHGLTDETRIEPAPVPIAEPIDFSHPDFCMTLRFQNVHRGTSRLYYSYNRGRDWQGPYQVPSFGQPGVMARTDYLVNGPRDCHVLLTASKQNQREGRVFCVRTIDGGLNWRFLSFVGPEPAGFAIMPSTVRVSDNHLVTTTRRREGPGEPRRRWIDSWESRDNGKSWNSLGVAVEDVGEGNPPSVIRLSDGRLCLTYGDRKPPFRIRAQFSQDCGNSWSEPWILRTGGGGRDIGYVRSLQRPDGKVATLYYFFTAENIYRRIVATIWDPGFDEG